MSLLKETIDHPQAGTISVDLRKCDNKDCPNKISPGNATGWIYTGVTHFSDSNQSPLGLGLHNKDFCSATCLAEQVTRTVAEIQIRAEEDKRQQDKAAKAIREAVENEG